MLFTVGSRGDMVKAIQRIVGVSDDGVFGTGTEKAVRNWQKLHGLKVDGLVGRGTLGKMGLLDTDSSLIMSDINQASQLYTKDSYITHNNLEVFQYFMPTNEYHQGPIEPEWIFLHHTAGWHIPYNTIKYWDSDKNGAIGTEFVMGGQSVKGNDSNYDGEVVQAFPHKNWGYHLGDNGSQQMHVHSIGMEVCNFGYVVNGKTWANVEVNDSQIVTLDRPFRGYSHWHRYSDNQLKSLQHWLKFIANRDNINIREGLPQLIKDEGRKAFEFNIDAYQGQIKGVLTHTNTRKDKFDMFPQAELMDMLIEL